MGMSGSSKMRARKNSPTAGWLENSSASLGFVTAGTVRFALMGGCQIFGTVEVVERVVPEGDTVTACASRTSFPLPKSPPQQSSVSGPCASAVRLINPKMSQAAPGIALIVVFMRNGHTGESAAPKASLFLCLASHLLPFLRVPLPVIYHCPNSKRWTLYVIEREFS